MASIRIIRPALLVISASLVGACATQPAGSLDEKYFQQEAKGYVKVERDGQTLYCQNSSTIASLIPTKRCMTEAALRQRVEDWRRTRNPVERPMHATVGSIG